MIKLVFAVFLLCLSHACFAGWGVGKKSCADYLNAPSALAKAGGLEVYEEFSGYLDGYLTVFGEYLDNNPTEQYPYVAVQEKIKSYCKDQNMMYGVAVRKAVRDVFRPKQKLKEMYRE